MDIDGIEYFRRAKTYEQFIEVCEFITPSRFIHGKTIQKFVDYAVTESRFNQSLENTFPNNEPIDIKKMGDVIRWVVNDIVKEEMDTMIDNQIEPKDVNKYISVKVREMFFKLV